MPSRQRQVTIHLDNEMYEKLKEQAKIQRRSVNQQINFYIENQMEVTK